LRIIYITAQLPHGAGEAFLLPEIEQLRRTGHEVLLVPRSLKGPVIHGRHLLNYTRRESLFSPRVLLTAAKGACTSPVRTVAAARLLRGAASARLTAKNLVVFPKALWLATLAVRWTADHLHCHWAGTTATMTMLASKVSGIPWSLSTHRWDVVENNLLASKAASAAFIRFTSEAGLRLARRSGVGAIHNAVVLHMGVMVPAEVRRQHPRTPLVLCPGRLVEVKGHRFLIEAWRLLKERGVDGELWLAGDGALRTRLETLAANLGLLGSLRFLGGLPHQQLLKLYADGLVSIVTLASIDLGSGHHEGTPVALIEAMSHGVPAVATRTGGVPELVVPGAGILVPPEDPHGLADALQRLLENQTLREQMGNRARQRILEAYDVAQIVTELETAMASSRTRATTGIA
jgi:glycosyltransferase involved in cell wall biosynthesis